MKKITLNAFAVFLIIFLFPNAVFSQSETVFANPDGSGVGKLLLILSLVAVTFIAAIFLFLRTSALRESLKQNRQQKKTYTPKKIVQNWDQEQVYMYGNYKKMKGGKKENK